MPARRDLLQAAAASALTASLPVLPFVPGRAMAARPSAAAPLAAAPPEPTTVVYPRHLPQQDRQVDYFISLLHAALQRSGTRYALIQTQSEMVQSRALLEMASSDPGIDVFWTMTDPQREKSLLPVRVPLDRGLIGWRLCLTRAADRDRLRDVKDLKDLARLTAGQMHDWPDTAVLRANGLPVQVSTHYQGLFQMLSAGRFDYFPRSIFEIDSELASFADQQLVIDPYLLLHYPAALYMFVRPGRPRLAADLTRGMNALVADGTFERLSRQIFGDLLQRHRIDQRRVLQLRNPLLPAQTPLDRKALWWPLPGLR
ncbi:ABC transporter substrate-binding protein [Mitsuaria sp. 7]|uniref:substrate-binding periplasmic protein n=1 Tax=Mitsuaria sp. 7 TaxID=1658665 RepID=UPI0009EF2AD2|nr:transporter substrate-binding domain-containing protein [Mitsuaria sp. 7]